MKVLKDEIQIDASPERVRQVLTNFGANPGWNPFITTCLKPGLSC
jgi:hypothetical protein